MTDQDRLQTIIETALRHGADLSPLNEANGDTWEAHEHGVEIINRWGECYLAIPVSTVLFGNGCGVLKAACGDGWMNKQGERLTDTGPCEETWHIAYEFVALKSILLPDNERLSFICDHLR